MLLHRLHFVCYRKSKTFGDLNFQQRETSTMLIELFVNANTQQRGSVQHNASLVGQRRYILGTENDK
jgi:hypothetical protein